jgi:hypothetical protein
MKGCIIIELGHRDPQLPFLRGIMHTTPQVHLQTLIHSLSLSISLRVVISAGDQSYFSEPE